MEPLSEKTAIGQKLDVVGKELDKMGIEWRIEREDGEGRMLTFEFESNRWNLTVEKGIVTAVRMG